MSRGAIVVAMALLSGGCGSSCTGPGNDPGGADEAAPVDVPSTQATLAVEIGTGEDGFTTLPDGGSVDLVHGPQGGYHIWTAVRVHGVPSEGLRANVWAVATGAYSWPASGWAGPWTPVADAAELAGMRAFVDPSVRDQYVTLRVEVVAPDGRHGADQRTVRPR